VAGDGVAGTAADAFPLVTKFPSGRMR
jgi:hypothetical protein